MDEQVPKVLEYVRATGRALASNVSGLALGAGSAGALLALMFLAVDLLQAIPDEETRITMSMPFLAGIMALPFAAPWLASGWSAVMASQEPRSLALYARVFIVSVCAGAVGAGSVATFFIALFYIESRYAPLTVLYAREGLSAGKAERATYAMTDASTNRLTNAGFGLQLILYALFIAAFFSTVSFAEGSEPSGELMVAWLVALVVLRGVLTGAFQLAAYELLSTSREPPASEA